MSRIIQPTPIVLDKPRTLFYNFNALILAEVELTKLWGKRTTAPQVLASIYGGGDGSVSLLSERISIAELAIILWSGCVHEDKALTLNALGEVLYFFDLETIIPTIVGALNLSMTPDEPAHPQSPFLSELSPSQ